MKEKTIYISEDGLKFENKLNCEEYEKNILSRLQYDIDTWYKPRKNTKPSFNYPDLDFTKHSWEGIKQVIVDLATLSNIFWIEHQTYSTHDNNVKFIDIMNNIKMFDCIEDEVEKFKIQNKILFNLDYLVRNVFYHNEKMIRQLITDRIFNRLRNTDFITGYEYPNSKWIGRHEDFIKYRDEELKYQKEGGVYR